MYRSCSFLCRLIYVLPNTYFTHETLDFSCFLLSAVMSRKTLEAVINSQHMATGFTAVITPLTRGRPILSLTTRQTSPFFKPSPTQEDHFIFLSSPFIKAIQDLLPPDNWESALWSLHICLLLKCTRHFWQFGSDLLSDSRPRRLNPPDSVICIPEARPITV